MNDESDAFTAYRQDLLRLREQTDPLIFGHLALVISLASRYRFSGLPLSDLIQAGNVGLLLAARKFDPSKGFQFSTYATKWIRKVIWDTIKDQAHTVRVPRYRFEQLADLRDARQRLLQHCSEEPLPSQLAEVLGYSSELVEQLLLIEQQARMVSLDAAQYEDGSSLADLLEADAQTNPEHLSQAKLCRSEVSALLSTLSKEEKTVLMLRFSEEEPKSYQEIGRELGRVPDTIRRIEQRALLKLRREAMLRHLEDFL